MRTPDVIGLAKLTGRTPSAALKKVLHALESPRPKIRYYVTVPSYFFALIRRILPGSALDWVLQQVSKGENR